MECDNLWNNCEFFGHTTKYEIIFTQVTQLSHQPLHIHKILYMWSGWCDNWVTRRHARCNNENTKLYTYVLFIKYIGNWGKAKIPWPQCYPVFPELSSIFSLPNCNIDSFPVVSSSFNGRYFRDLLQLTHYSCIKFLKLSGYYVYRLA